MYCIDANQYLFNIFHREWEAATAKQVEKVTATVGQDAVRLWDLLHQLVKRLASGGLHRLRGRTLRDVGSALASENSSALEKGSEAVSETIISRIQKELKQTSDHSILSPVLLSETLLNLMGAEAGQLADMPTVKAQIEKQLKVRKSQVWASIKGCPFRCPRCGTKCNHSDDDHVAKGLPHRCSVHLLPAFSGLCNTYSRLPQLNPCRSTSTLEFHIQVGGESIPYLKWLQQKHPHWLFKGTKWTDSNRPQKEYDTEDCSEIFALRRAWVHMKEALYEHHGGFEIGHAGNKLATTPVVSLWEEKYPKGHGLLKKGMLVDIKSRLYKQTPDE